MKVVTIVGKNYPGHFEKTRVACRVLVQQEGRLLMSYEKYNDRWMIPGGGVEPDETEAACCVREMVEETGLVVEPSQCLLEIDEYYADCKWVHKYFLGKVVGVGERSLTEYEASAGMEPRWIDAEKIREIFSRHRDYEKTDETTRGMYLREFTALNELWNNLNG